MLSYLERLSQLLPVVVLALVIGVVYTVIEHFVTNKDTAPEQNVQRGLKSRYSTFVTNTIVTILCLFQRKAK